MQSQGTVAVATGQASTNATAPVKSPFVSAFTHEAPKGEQVWIFGMLAAEVNNTNFRMTAALTHMFVRFQRSHIKYQSVGHGARV